jgi:hypothetical protein
LHRCLLFFFGWLVFLDGRFIVTAIRVHRVWLLGFRFRLSWCNIFVGGVRVLNWLGLWFGGRSFVFAAVGSSSGGIAEKIAHRLGLAGLPARHEVDSGFQCQVYQEKKE